MSFVFSLTPILDKWGRGNWYGRKEEKVERGGGRWWEWLVPLKSDILVSEGLALLTDMKTKV